MTREEAAVVKAAREWLRANERDTGLCDGSQERCTIAQLRLERAITQYEAWLKRMAKGGAQ